ncbi:MAG: tRNA (adenosine(37)-N6)-dimethylallyltransferase MiaA [Longimicrobiales bacterium]
MAENSREPDAIVITGATATGKTALSIEVARALKGEIISVDSRQVYRGMDIGTAKPTTAQQQAVPHHALDLISPDQRYSAGRFARDARAWMAEIRARGHLPILTGGTGFFLRALTHPMFDEPELPRVERRALAHWLARKPDAELQRWLSVLDPELAKRLAREGGRQRRLRGLEIPLLTGYPLSWWHQQAPNSREPLPLRTFVVALPREALYRRINERVVAMIDAGLVDEVRALQCQGFDQDSPGLNATGYIELLPYLRGETELASAIDAIQRATRRYARRQLTWFRHQLPEGAIHLDGHQERTTLVQQIVQHWQEEVSSAHRH